jgi:hypothetical protein
MHGRSDRIFLAAISAALVGLRRCHINAGTRQFLGTHLALDQEAPVGAGPYRFVSLIRTHLANHIKASSRENGCTNRPDT